MITTTREVVKEALIQSFENEYRIHPAKNDYNYDGYRNDLYPSYLDDELNRLKDTKNYNGEDSDDASTIDRSNLKCLSYISAVDTVESNIDQSRELLIQLEKEEMELKKRLTAETNLHDELFALRGLLRQRTETINNSIKPKDPQTIFEEIDAKKLETDKNNKFMLGELKRLLRQHVAPRLAAHAAAAASGSGPTERELASDLKSTVEDLLNEMFKSEDESDGYVRVTNPQSPIVQFLLRGELVITKPDDMRYIKLRDFGRD